MTLQQIMASLPTEKLKEIQAAIIDAGITCEFKGDYKLIFSKLRTNASGRQKKIYSALAKAGRNEMQRMSDVIITMKI